MLRNILLSYSSRSAFTQDLFRVTSSSYSTHDVFETEYLCYLKQQQNCNDARTIRHYLLHEQIPAQLQKENKVWNPMCVVNL